MLSTTAFATRFNTTNRSSPFLTFAPLRVYAKNPLIADEVTIRNGRPHRSEFFGMSSSYLNEPLATPLRPDLPHHAVRDLRARWCDRT